MGVSHRWVPVNAHSAPVPSSPGRLWVAHRSNPTTPTHEPNRLHGTPKVPHGRGALLSIQSNTRFPQVSKEQGPANAECLTELDDTLHAEANTVHNPTMLTQSLRISGLRASPRVAARTTFVPDMCASSENTFPQRQEHHQQACPTRVGCHSEQERDNGSSQRTKPSTPPVPRRVRRIGPSCTRMTMRRKSCCPMPRP